MYTEAYGIEYNPQFWGQDAKVLKKSLEKYGPFETLCAMKNAFNEPMVPPITVTYFCKAIEKWLPDHDPKLEWYARTVGDDKIKFLWREYVLTANRWFPNQESTERASNIKTYMEKWVAKQYRKETWRVPKE